MKQLLVFGGKPLSGSVEIEGAKNAALPILFGTLLCGGVSRLSRVPCIGDVEMAQLMLKEWGAEIEYLFPHTLKIDTQKAKPPRRSSDYGKALRGSLYTLGAGLARFGEAYCEFPGGCNLGTRPIDQHLKVLSALGAEITFEENGVRAKTKGLRGTDFHFDVVSVGATVNGILAATGALGATRLSNIAQEPHIEDLIHYLNQCGANIQKDGKDSLIIYGNAPLRGTDYTLTGDTMEAGTYLIAGVATEGEVTVKGICPWHLESLILAMQKAGVEVTRGENQLTARRVAPLKPIEITTAPYPAFPSDLHPQMTAMLAGAKGVSKIQETVWTERFRYTEELSKLGVKTKRKDATLEIFGGERLVGNIAEATDLRGGAAVVIAALMAKGMTVIENAPVIFRGYENMAKKLQTLGADIYERHGA